MIRKLKRMIEKNHQNTLKYVKLNYIDKQKRVFAGNRDRRSRIDS